MSEEVSERRSGLSRYNPFISILNAMVTLILSGGVVAWAIGQEKADSAHSVLIVANEKYIQRVDRDALQNRTDIQNALAEINKELKELNRRLAK
jgi:hypothetical protein